MKKYILLVATAFASAFLTAQIVQPLDHDSFEPVEGDIYVFGDVENPDDFEITTKFHIESVSGEALTVEVRRIIISEVEGSTNKFCWAGVCYTETDDFSLNTITMNPGDVFNSENPAQQFKGYYYHNGNSGLTQINYRFSDVNDSQNNSIIPVFYAVEGANNLIERASAEASLSVPSPNPITARSNVSFDYGYRPTNGRLLINNMMGQVVKEISVEERYGVLFLDATDLPEGIYLYTLQDGNEVLQTKKFVVAR